MEMILLGEGESRSLICDDAYDPQIQETLIYALPVFSEEVDF